MVFAEIPKALEDLDPGAVLRGVWKIVRDSKNVHWPHRDTTDGVASSLLQSAATMAIEIQVLSRMEAAL
jgi:hypothetical protein